MFVFWKTPLTGRRVGLLFVFMCLFFWITPLTGRQVVLPFVFMLSKLHPQVGRLATSLREALEYDALLALFQSAKEHICCQCNNAFLLSG